MKLSTIINSLVAIFFSLSSASLFAKSDKEHQFSEPVAALHKVLAPLWHAESGKERQGNTCDNILTMTKLSAEIDASEKLLKTLNDLDLTCNGTISAFDAQFHIVHDAFHEIVDREKAQKLQKAQ
ncbi:hypothetical protein ACUR5C_01185 [Aliikangiella sp. IMCC44653]